jgi:two-component system, cell cycle sensor histidine kinase and response regulator CckA
MKDLSIDQIRFRVRLCVGLILLAVVGISAWSIVSERSNVMAAAEKIAAGYCRALAENSDSAFSEADGMLRVLQGEIRGAGGLESADRHDLLDKMRRQIGAAPQMGVMFLVDAQGIMRLNSGADPFKEVSVADRDYYRNYLGTRDLQLTFGNPLLSRLTKHWRFNMIRPLSSPAEPFGGLIVAGFENDFFSSFLNPDTLGPHGRVMLVRNDGVPLVSAPLTARAYRTDFKQSPLFKQRRNQARSGIYFESSPLTEDRPTMVSYHRLGLFPVVAMILLDREDVLAPWARKAATQSGLVLGLCLVIIVLTRLIFNHLERLKLAQGTVSEQQVELSIKASQIDAANDAILQIDGQGRLMHFNQALCRITGYSARELSGLRLHDIEPPEFAHLIIPNLALIKQLKQATFESAYLAKDGTVVPVEVHARLMESQGRSLILSIARDITGRKRAELREAGRRAILEQVATGAPLEELLSGIVRFVEQELPEALCSVLLADESDGTLRHGAAPSLPEAYNQAVDGLAIAKGMGSCGSAAFLLQRVVVEDIATHPYWKGFAPARAAGLLACWAEPVLSSEGELLGTVSVYHREPHAPKDDELSMTASAAHLASIAIERVRGEESRRTLEGHLRQVQKIEAVGQLAAGIAHDFNNLLTPIFVYADLIRGGFPEGHPQIRLVDAVVLAAHKASELTRKLLSFGRKQLLCMEVLDLNEVISSFADIMRTTVRESISFDLRLAPERVRFLGDPGQMEQILLNLTVNAQDAIGDNGAIIVETGHLILDEEYARLHSGVRPGAYVLLAFTDTGCGMDDDTLRHIYEPFFTTKEVGRGTGLGLATVYGIVKQHDGYIDVWSRPGEGTSFKIYLPMSREQARRPASQGPEVQPLQAAAAGQTIFLVEDNTLIREMAQELLEAHGYRTLVAATPVEALELAAGHHGPMDLLISDVVMPQMNGPELYQRLTLAHRQLPVLYISGYTGSALARKDAPDLERNFLTKPFTLQQFLGRVQQILQAGA